MQGVLKSIKIDQAKFPLGRGTENDPRSFSGGCESFDK